jgi:predicted acetyltransferase
VFASWLLRIECDRCGKVQMVNESHVPTWRDRSLRDIIARMRHDGCGGRAGKAELLTGIEEQPVGAADRTVVA